MDPNLLAILCMVVGTLFLLLEILVIPGVGLAGVMGTLCLLGGVTIVWRTHGVASGIGLGVLTVAGSSLGAWAWSRTKTAQAFVLHKRLDGEAREKEERQGLLGIVGEAVTALRPAGSARLKGEVIDVVADGEFIEAGSPVLVVEVEGFRVVVRRPEDADTDTREAT